MTTNDVIKEVRTQPALECQSVALVGNPNTGKSTLFNALTGIRQRVGNYPGVTVEKRAGRWKGGAASQLIDVVDLPGTYSLSARSADEAVVLDELLGEFDDQGGPSVIVLVLDACHPQRSLFLATQVIEIGRPVVVALNMVDLAKAAGKHVDAELLSKRLGVPVVPVVASRGEGVSQLREAVLQQLETPSISSCMQLPPEVNEAADELAMWGASNSTGRGRVPARVEWLQALLDPDGFHERRLRNRLSADVAGQLDRQRQRVVKPGQSIQELEAQVRYAWIDKLLCEVVECPFRGQSELRTASDKADRWLTHRFFGLLVFGAILLVVFQSVYAWAGPFMDWIDAGFGFLGGVAASVIPDGALQSLIVDGVIGGVGGVVIFLPQILILFLFIAILEDCGYLSRAAFLVDRYMSAMGLSGKSVIPLLSSFACAIPGIMAARTIESSRQRLVTILIAPLMSCSARLPVYVLLIGAFVPNQSLLGGLLRLQAVVLVVMYLLGVVVAIPLAALLGRFVVRGESMPFLMELPTYKWPSWRTVGFRLWEQGREFVLRAGTVIVAVTIIIWALGYYPRPATAVAAAKVAGAAAPRVAESPSDVGSLEAAASIGTTADLVGEVSDGPDVSSANAAAAIGEPHAIGAVDAADVMGTADAAGGAGQASEPASAPKTSPTTDRDATPVAASEGSGAASDTPSPVHDSYLARIGRSLEPAVKPLGWDWRIATSAVASLPAREIVVASLGTIFNLDGEVDEESSVLREQLQRAKWPDGRPLFTLPVALSLMVFFALCCQCGATLAVIKRETNSWRWPVFTFVYMTGLAYVAALLTYQVGTALMG
jgi:ferrous iron transport protein B